MVPFIDLYRQHKGIMTDLEKVIKNVITNSRFVLEEELENFEISFSRYIGCRYAIGVDSGHGALVTLLFALGIGPGDEVILPANTFYTTAAAVRKVGARPILIDVNEKTYNINCELVKEKLTNKTRAIIPVHLYGLAADLDGIEEVIRNQNIKIIEDACQAHGAKYQERKVGCFGIAGCFSFYPTKNLGAMGEGGMVVTDDSEIATFIRAYRNCGRKNKYYHEILGENRRMHNLQAAILNVKLAYLDTWNEERRKAAGVYREKFIEYGIHDSGPFEPADCYHVYNLFVIRYKDRDGLMKYLKRKGIGIGIHYPIPIHLLGSMLDLGYKRGSFPITELVADEIISLPMFPGITSGEITEVVRSIAEYQQLQKRNK